MHWDEKLFEQGRDYHPKEHIAILSSHKDDKLLGTTQLESERGLNQVNAIKFCWINGIFKNCAWP